MRIALVVPIPWIANEWSVDLELLIEGFRTLGHQTEVVCPEGSRSCESLPVSTVRERDLRDTHFWAASGLDLAVVFTWMGFGSVLQALRQAGIFTISRGDTDGRHGVRAHPAATFIRAVAPAGTPLGKARAAWFWLRKYGGRGRDEDARILRSIEAAGVTVVETEAGRRNLCRFLDHCGRPDLAGKVGVIGYPITEDILSAETPDRKAPTIVAVGRWDQAQKDAPLLAASIERYVRSGGSAGVLILGRGGERWFADLCRRHSEVRYLGPVPHEQMVEHLAGARICLVTSRWESFHIAAHEALAMGCSVVGPPVIPVPDICAAGPFGTIAAGRRPAQVAAALHREMRAWECGERDAAEIARFWRPRLSAAHVARQFLALCEAGRQVEVGA